MENSSHLSKYELVTNVKVPFDKLHFPKWRRTAKTFKTELSIHALDTETADGIVHLIADSNGHYAYPSEFMDVLEWFRESELANSVIFCWNLDFDVRAILGLIPRMILEELYLMGTLKLEECTLRYIPHKYFRIKYEGRSYELYDLQQFHNMSLDEASKRYLMEGKTDIDAERIQNDAEYREENATEILEYCIWDCRITQRLGERFKLLLIRVGLTPRRYFSTGYLAEKYFVKHSRIPMIHFKRVQEFAYYSYAGGRFEVFKRGYFEDVYKYDIHSAYPAITAELPDIDRGVWRQSVKMDPDSVLAFSLVRVRVPHNYIEPLHYRDKYRVLFPSAGNHYRVITKCEYELIEEFNLAQLTPIRTWNFYPDTERKPFGIIKGIYKKRVAMKEAGDPLELVLKLIMNSIYGKTIQITMMKEPAPHYATGNLFLPCYASEITAQTRVNLVRTCLENDLDPIAFFTDAILTTDKFNGVSNVLGGWGLEKRGECVLLGSGVYGFRDVKGESTKLRGFRTRRDISLFDLLEANATKRVIEVPQRVVLTLGQYLRHYHKYVGVNMNVFLQEHKTININFDVKRVWEREFDNCHDALTTQINSEPVTVTV